MARLVFDRLRLRVIEMAEESPAAEKKRKPRAKKVAPPVAEEPPVVADGEGEVEAAVPQFLKQSWLRHRCGLAPA